MKLAANDFQLGPAVLAGARVRDGAAERLGHRLEAIADAEHRDSEVEQRRVEPRGAVGVHAGGPAGEHHRLRIAGLDLLDRGGVRNDLGIHPGLRTRRAMSCAYCARSRSRAPDAEIGFPRR
jgi:hypothetical protein